MKKSTRIKIFTIMILMLLLGGIGLLNLKKTAIENESTVGKEIIKNIQKVKNKINKKPGEGMIITCWGDSLTAGAKGEGVTYPQVLAELSGSEVHNYGVGGETSLGIAARQGGIPMQVNNITIPVEGSVVLGNLASSGIYSVHGEMLTPLLQGGDSSINPCTIAGVRGSLDWTGTDVTDENGVFVFTRETPGEEVIIGEPTNIITSAMEDRTEDILVIFIGQNGGWIDNQDLVNQIQAIIDYSVCGEKYIVCGLTSESGNSRAELEALMESSFGEKYLNLREYLVEQGLKDAGVTPSPQDLGNIESQSVPNSLRSDDVHGNSLYYQLVGEKIYERILELEYFEIKDTNDN